ncbi:MAG: class I SAM-dependent methyltransferase [Campylobacterota bacterium]|nr:class I SAM-dependent methyltransferase [Campylobacterota bacterium]
METNTKANSYAQRLVSLQNKTWKKRIKFLNPYRYHLSTICKGQVLEVGCGIGRVLDFIPQRSVGVDHNNKAVEICKSKGLNAFTSEEFLLEHVYKKESFDTLLFSHVLEHMSFEQAQELLNIYLPFLKKNGIVVLITPQLKGYQSDPTHIENMDIQTLQRLAKNLNIKEQDSYSFPFPSYFGKYFIYNENAFIGIKK